MLRTILILQICVFNCSGSMAALSERMSRWIVGKRARPARFAASCINNHEPDFMAMNSRIARLRRDHARRSHRANRLRSGMASRIASTSSHSSPLASVGGGLWDWTWVHVKTMVVAIGEIEST
jgi:hypothetical protein